MSRDEIAEFAVQLRDRARLFVEQADLRALEAQQSLDRAERFLDAVSAELEPVGALPAPEARRAGSGR